MGELVVLCDSPANHHIIQIRIRIDIIISERSAHPSPANHHIIQIKDESYKRDLRVGLAIHHAHDVTATYELLAPRLFNIVNVLEYDYF